MPSAYLKYIICVGLFCCASLGYAQELKVDDVAYIMQTRLSALSSIRMERRFSAGTDGELFAVKFPDEMLVEKGTVVIIFKGDGFLYIFDKKLQSFKRAQPSNYKELFKRTLFAPLSQLGIVNLDDIAETYSFDAIEKVVKVPEFLQALYSAGLRPDLYVLTGRLNKNEGDWSTMVRYYFDRNLALVVCIQEYDLRPAIAGEAKVGNAKPVLEMGILKVKQIASLFGTMKHGMCLVQDAVQLMRGGGQHTSRAELSGAAAPPEELNNAYFAVSGYVKGPLAKKFGMEGPWEANVYLDDVPASFFDIIPYLNLGKEYGGGSASQLLFWE